MSDLKIRHGVGVHCLYLCRDGHGSLRKIGNARNGGQDAERDLVLADPWWMDPTRAPGVFAGGGSGRPGDEMLDARRDSVF